MKGTVTTTNFNWDALMTLDPTQPIPDEVANAMAAQLGYSKQDGTSKKALGMVLDPETGVGIPPSELTVEQARDLLRQAGLLGEAGQGSDDVHPTNSRE